jgi:hypothetical protein
MAGKFTITEKIDETLKDFKALLPRYREVKGNAKLFQLFMSRNRNPLWDLSGNKIFKTGLKSRTFLESNTKGGVEDHFIQRTKSMKIVFHKLDENPDMSVEEFTNLIIAYSSTVTLTKEEHNTVTTFAKNNDMLNYQAYNVLGIEVVGLSEFMIERNILF